MEGIGPELVVQQLFLGDDRATVSGRPGPIVVRVIGGGGDDRITLGNGMVFGYLAALHIAERAFAVSTSPDHSRSTEKATSSTVNTETPKSPRMREPVVAVRG